MKTMLYFYLAILFLISVNVPALGQGYPVLNAVDPAQNINARFRLFKTGNAFTFLELDTRSGFIYQVQYSVSDAPIGSVCINGKELFETGDTPRDGRFTLYSTQNLYNFILVDQDKGKLWQCQWSLDPKKRFLIPMPILSEQAPQAVSPQTSMPNPTGEKNSSH